MRKSRAEQDWMRPFYTTPPAEKPAATLPQQKLRRNESAPKLIRVLNRDLKAAGIPKVDERGRQVDVHALRHTFGTLLSKAGVAPRTAQAAMRHSRIDLTMNVYTDPRLLDVAGAMETLPSLPLGGGDESAPNAVNAAGTDDLLKSALAPALAPTVDLRSQ
jgi:integrase